jgi:hypothetical protein
VTAIESALTDLQAQREVMAKQLGKLDEAISALVNVLGPEVSVHISADTSQMEGAISHALRQVVKRQPAPHPAVARRVGAADGRTAVADAVPDAELATRLMQALSEGPLSTGKLALAAHATDQTVKSYMKRLAEKGLVHSEGNTHQQRWHLGAAGAGRRTPAKEAPSRHGGRK